MEVVKTLLSISEGLGYWGIVFLMAIESSFIPFPSEIIIPPAAYLAALGKFNIYLVVIAGIAGSLIGAIINYFLALTLGRKIIYSLSDTRLAKILLINRNKIEKAEKYFLRYGKISTLFGRLIFAIRQLISIPAGFAKMNFFSFLVFTFLGSSVWIIILSVLGYTLGANEGELGLIYEKIKYGTLFAVFTILIVIVIFKVKKRKAK
ncbi:DedA family protein [bacterium]|nr:DedA family protein [bacterium]